MNLITNASEAIGDRPGRIRLHTAMTDCDAATLGAAGRMSFHRRPVRRPGSHGHRLRHG